MQIHEYDVVELNDGTIGTIVDVTAPGVVYELDIGDSPSTWDTITIKHDQIKKFVNI